MLSEATNKKRRLVIGLLTLSLFVGLFLGQRTALAAGPVIAEQLIYADESNSSLYWHGLQYLNPALTFPATDINLTLKLKNISASTQEVYGGFIVKKGTEYGCGPSQSLLGSLEAYETKTLTILWPEAEVEDCIDTKFLNDPTKDFVRFEIWSYPGNTSVKILGSNNPDSYLIGYYKRFDGGSTYSDDSNVKDVYFSLNQVPQNSIEFVFPVNATSTPDFESWHLNFGVAGEPPVAGSVKVNYGKDPNNYWNEYHDEINFIAYDNEVAEVAIMKSNLLSAGSWFAGGELIIGTSTVKTTVPDIAFSVLGGGGYLENFYYEAPTTTWATSTLPIQITCDPEDSFFQYSLCKLAVWLFVPDSGQLNKFSALTDGIKNKPPIGYFYAVKSALEGLQSTSTKAFELNATSTGALANPVFNPLKTGISFTLWLTFGFWLFGRIRHFEL